MKKHLDFKNNTVLLTLFALLFVTTSVHTLAIIRTENKNDAPEQSQTAQVTTLAGCLQVTHKGNIDTLQFFDESELTPANQYWYRQYFNIKNICSSTVHVVNPTGLNPNNFPNALSSLSYTKLQTHTNLVPEDVALIGNNYQASVVFEALACPDCESGALAQHYSPLATGQSGQISAYALAPQQTRLFEITVLASMPDFLYSPMRITSDKIKYFPQSAVAGGIAAREIKTHSFPVATQNAHATDYLYSSHSPGFEPMILGGGNSTAIQKGPGLPSLSAVEVIKSLSQ